MKNNLTSPEAIAQRLAAAMEAVAAAAPRLDPLTAHLTARQQAQRDAEIAAMRQIPPKPYIPGAEWQPPEPTDRHSTIPATHAAIWQTLVEHLPPELDQAARDTRERANECRAALQAAQAERTRLDSAPADVSEDVIERIITRRAILDVRIPLLEQQAKAANDAYSAALVAAREALAAVYRTEIRPAIGRRILEHTERAEAEQRAAGDLELARLYAESQAQAWLPE